MLPRYFPLVLLLLLLQVVHRSSALEGSSNAAVEAVEDIASGSSTPAAERKSWSVKKTASSFTRKVKKVKDTALSSPALLKNRMTALSLTSLRKPKKTPPTQEAPTGAPSSVDQSDLSPAHLSEDEELEPEEIASEPEDSAPASPLGRAPLPEEHPTTSASHPEAAGPHTSHDEQLSHILAFDTGDEDLAYLEALRLSQEHSQPAGGASLPEFPHAASYHPEVARPDTSHDLDMARQLQEQLNAGGDEFGHHFNDHHSNELWESFPMGTHDSTHQGDEFGHQTNELWESFPMGTHDYTHQPEPRGPSPMPSWGAEQPRQPSPPQSWQTPAVADEPLRRRLDPNGNRGQSSREVQPRYGAPSTSTAGVSQSTPLSMVEKDDKIHPITAFLNIIAVVYFVLFLYKKDMLFLPFK
ncbi:hypothetical protein PCANC_24243 [Puccinia coronata f. sp. avenae]|uniref:Uncharacterized protein n=1 Tax=Puccinia coronata f. sp. avenae TaxID=200324 RepID=A0A2N5SFG3_9BASI|nr:hypothetical protein PCANC_24243 [Puccinia coronata f. sp. avenae]